MDLGLVANTVKPRNRTGRASSIFVEKLLYHPVEKRTSQFILDYIFQVSFQIFLALLWGHFVVQTVGLFCIPKSCRFPFELNLTQVEE